MKYRCSRRDFLGCTGLGLAAALMGQAAPGLQAGQAARKKPNFMVILVDDMGFADPGCYGGEIMTPNLDGLAANGLRFTNFYNTGRCWPSRACILTGYYAQQVRRDALPPQEKGGMGVRPGWAPLLPKLLKPLGYRSYHSGKWHVDGKPEEQGFDLSYHYDDSDRHFLPARCLEKAGKPLGPENPEGYYATTATADNAIRQLRDHAAQHRDAPFFSYVAFTEPHFPVQALKEDIDRYRTAYLKGWDQVRAERLARQKEKGIVNCGLSKLEPDVVPGWNLKPEVLKSTIDDGEAAFAVPWDTLTEEQKKFQALKMAVHAAMIDRIDREVGRLLDELKRMGEYENTVVMFMSDNGASAEQMNRGDKHDRSVPPGSARSFICLGPGFSSAANTPFRLHKSWVHEGGISTPLVVHWPVGIRARGELRHNVGHLVDIPPTLLELAGGQWPEKYEGLPVPARPGRSLVPAFEKDGTVARDYLWWYHSGNRAIRVGDWKLVARGKDAPWELYDLSTDRCESVDLTAGKPDKVRELAEKWQKCAEECAALAGSDGKSGAGGKKRKQHGTDGGGHSND